MLARQLCGLGYYAAIAIAFVIYYRGMIIMLTVLFQWNVRDQIVKDDNSQRQSKPLRPTEFWCKSALHLLPNKINANVPFARHLFVYCTSISLCFIAFCVCFAVFLFILPTESWHMVWFLAAELILVNFSSERSFICPRIAWFSSTSARTQWHIESNVIGIHLLYSLAATTTISK